MRIIRSAAMAGFIALALMACDDNPVSEDRDVVFRLFLSPKVVNLTVDSEKRITGYALNRYGEQTFDDVTAEACDATVAISPDTSLLPIEPPTRILARGNAVGESCIVFRGGGLTDSVKVRVH